MTSSVTTPYKKVVLDIFKDDIASTSTKYYVGLAGTETILQPESIVAGSELWQQKLRHRLISIKTASSTSFVVKSYLWSNRYDNGQGGIIPQFTDVGTDNYYIVNSFNEVFVCVKTGQNIDGSLVASTVEPTRALAIAANGQSKTFRTNDQPSDTTGESGYLWRYIYTLSNVALSLFKTTDWIPVKTIVSETQITQEKIQKLNQDSATAGEIIGFAIDSAGTGYTAAPTITILGNGDSAAFNCLIDEGKIVRVLVDSNGNGIFNHGYGYQYAAASLSSGDAILRPIISQKGLTKDPVDTLRSESLMLQVDFVGDETDTILAQNEFNQICVLRKPKKFTTVDDSDYIASTGNCLKSLTLASGGPTGFQLNEKFNNGGTGIGIVAAKLGDILYYYQTEETGFTAFQEGNSVTGEITGANSAVQVGGVGDPDIDLYSGDILYINNYGAEALQDETDGVDRTENQTEDLRIVFQLG